MNRTRCQNWSADTCGMIATFDRRKNIAFRTNCGAETDIYPVEVSYAFKSLGVAPRLELMGAA